MNPDEKLVMYWFTALILIAPFAFWAALRLAILIGFSATAETLLLIQIFRWSVWAAALVLVVLYFMAIVRLDAWPLAVALSASSTGLSIPQRWLKARIAREASTHP
jgi:hypothetical protein